jgi:tryptophan synthase alpha chain
MTRIDDRFRDLHARREDGLILFITAGDPDIDTTSRLIHELEKAGADLIELGVPFTDPLADGPTIQRSSERALRSGTTLESVFNLTLSLRTSIRPNSTSHMLRAGYTPTSIPIVLMTYYNPILQYGLDRFAARCSECGVDGIIATDLPPEEADGWIRAARTHSVDTIFLLAPTSTDERVKNVARLATGFVYCVSRLGVTGARETVPADLSQLIARIRKLTEKPIAAGFGLSTPEQIRQVVTETDVDAVVIGSALINRICEVDLKTGEGIRQVGEFVRDLKAATVTSSAHT